MTALRDDEQEPHARAKVLRFVHPDAPNGAPVGWRPSPHAGKPKASKGIRHSAIDAAICESGLPSTQRLVLFALNRRIGWKAKRGREAGTCYVSVRRIRLDSGLSERAVRKHLRELERVGWLEVTRTPEHVTCTYKITPR